MTYAEALALCVPFVCDDPDRVNLVRPWKQWIGDQPCLCAADGIAAIFVRLPVSEWSPIPWVEDVPSLESAIPVAAFGTDVTAAMRHAREAARAVPGRTLRRKRNPPLVTANEETAMVYQIETVLEAQQTVTGEALYLSALHVARLPEIESAVKYGATIVMRHGPDVGSVLMTRRVPV